MRFVGAMSDLQLEIDQSVYNYVQDRTGHVHSEIQVRLPNKNVGSMKTLQLLEYSYICLLLVSSYALMSKAMQYRTYNVFYVYAITVQRLSKYRQFL